MTQREALDILKLGHNVYLTGSAGSGKTFLLNQYIAHLKNEGVGVAVTASTGIAASHMGGATIHSWSGLGIRSALSPYDLEALEEKRYLWDRFQKTSVLIIDEISMLHHYRLDLVNQICQFFKRNDAPFGGLQVVLCGDFFQLPPVARAGEPDAHFAYHSQAWNDLNLKTCYLTESHRHTDSVFTDILNAIRQNAVTAEHKNQLKQRINGALGHTLQPTKLYTHNSDVDGINVMELGKKSGTVRAYQMESAGAEPLVQSLKKSCLAYETLSLKVGAQVMFVKNNPDAGYVNGTLGTVVECGQLAPVVKTVKGVLIRAEPVDWSIEENGKVKATITQVPLRLAWAITVHKSQGMTLDCAEIDLSKSFEKGMGYVALSRLKSLSGLNLLGMNDAALDINEEVLIFDEDLQKASAILQQSLARIDPREKAVLQKKFLDRVAPLRKKGVLQKVKPKAKAGDSVAETGRLLQVGQSVATIAATRGLKQDTVVTHVEELLEKKKITVAGVEHLKTAISPELYVRIEQAFRKAHTRALSPVKELLPAGVSFVDIRIVRLLLSHPR